MKILQLARDFLAVVLFVLLIGSADFLADLVIMAFELWR